MPARYSFETARRDALLSGELAATLRALGRKRHARVGERVALYVGARPLATAVVTCRAKLILGPRTLLRVTENHCAPAGEGLEMLIRAAEQGRHGWEATLPRLAVALGFGSWEALYTWQAAHGVTAGERLWRELIGWDASTLEPLAGASGDA